MTAGGNYEASLILLDSLWTKTNIPVDGDFVIGIPARDILLVTGSNNKREISIAQRKVKEIYTTGNYQVSDNLYRRVNGKFVKLKLP